MHATRCNRMNDKPVRIQNRPIELPVKEPRETLSELLEETRRLHASLARCRTIIARLAAERAS